MLTVYCIRRAEEPGPAPGLAGVEGGEVRRVEEGGLAAWVSEPGGLPATAERLRQHDRVVRAALRSATPLPVRYGAAFATEAAVRALLAERRDEFAAALERLAGRVEMGVRVGWRPGAAPAPAPDPLGPPRSGREFLERRRERLRGEERLRESAARLLDAVEAELAAPGLPVARTVLASEDTAGLLAHLVRSTEIRPYLRRVDEARSRLPDVELVASGPWAPYSFL